MLHFMTEDRRLSTLSAVAPLSCHRGVMILSTSADVISEMGMEAIFSQCLRDKFQLALVSIPLHPGSFRGITVSKASATVGT